MLARKHDDMGEPNFWIPFVWKGQKELIWWSVGKNGLRATFRTGGLQSPGTAVCMYCLGIGIIDGGAS
jgi:hypothetical protein